MVHNGILIDNYDRLDQDENQYEDVEKAILVQYHAQKLAHRVSFTEHVQRIAFQLHRVVAPYKTDAQLSRL